MGKALAATRRLFGEKNTGKMGTQRVFDHRTCDFVDTNRAELGTFGKRLEQTDLYKYSYMYRTVHKIFLKSFTGYKMTLLASKL
jgi:hypothetical protein